VRNNKRGEYTHRILVAQGGDYHIGLYTQQDAKPTYKTFAYISEPRLIPGLLSLEQVMSHVPQF
jgi:hypothetical protein